MNALRKTTRIVLSVALALLAGCSAHYRAALEEYQKAEPFPFEQRTLAWVADSDRETSPTQEAMPIPVSSPLGKGESESDVFLKLASDLFDVPGAELATRMASLETTAGLEAALNDQLRWSELRLAVVLYNPAIHAARARWQATLRQYSQADFLDGLIAQYRMFTRSLNVQTGKPMNKEMIQRFFPFPSTIALKGEVIRLQVRMAELDWQKTMRDSVIEAGDAFLDFQYVHRAQETTRENVALAENLLGVVEERYRAGRAAQPDLLKAQTELERQRNMLSDLEARRRSVAARINALLDRPPAAPLGPPDDADLMDSAPEYDPLVDEALRSRQEVNLQRAKVARGEAAIRMGEVMNRPLASQGYSAFERGMMPEASEAESRMPFGMMAKASDRPAFAQAEAYLAEMRTRLNGERSMLEQVEARTRSLAAAMLEDLDIARREVRLIEEIVLPQNRSAYETALAAYTSGRVSFLDLLDAERALLKARLELHDVRRALSKAVLHLAEVRGSFAATE